MKIFLFGANGMLGNYINTYLKQTDKSVICFTRKEFDVSCLTYDNLSTLLNKYILDENDIIINCIGIIPQSNSINDTSNRNYFLINTLFPNMLS